MCWTMVLETDVNKQLMFTLFPNFKNLEFPVCHTDNWLDDLLEIKVTGLAFVRIKPYFREAHGKNDSVERIVRHDSYDCSRKFSSTSDRARQFIVDFDVETPTRKETMEPVRCQGVGVDRRRQSRKMTGLPCTVAAVLVVALLGTVADSAYVCETPESPKVSQIPEKCFNEVSTGSEMSNEERQSAVNAVNLYRGFITNQCDKFKSGKPKSANFRKIRYSCDLEKQVKFTCPAKANDAFTTSGTVFRRVDIVYETSFFYRAAPWLHEIDINGQTLDFVDNSVRLSETMRFYLNGNAGEIGCYLKKCHGKEYVACTTGTTIPTSGPLYTPGTRCRSNNDCLDTGYPICDTEFGLCKQGMSIFIVRYTYRASSGTNFEAGFLKASDALNLLSVRNRPRPNIGAGPEELGSQQASTLAPTLGPVKFSLLAP
uniref:SCP domain-containing protein n=1 Tax=Panagrellus redivivus TaxID=6233 RepID=A0A7E4UY26_PANRE